MTQRNNPARVLRIATPDARGTALRLLPYVTALLLVLVLITVLPGAGTGFA